MDLKCVLFNFKPIPNNPYLLEDLLFASVTFNKETILNYYNSSSNFTLYFINKEPNTFEMNGIEEILFQANNSTGNQTSKQLVSISSNLICLKQEDIFSYLKQSLSLFFKPVNLNDTTEYIKELHEGFGNFDLRTKVVPLLTNQKELEIDVSMILGFKYLKYSTRRIMIIIMILTKNIFQDLLFDQFYYQIKETDDLNSPRVIDFDRNIYLSGLQEEQTDLKGHDIDFYLFDVFETAKTVNRENHSKIVLGALNCLSFWFNFCVLDIHLYIQRSFGLFTKLYELLLLLKSKLNLSIVNCSSNLFST